MQPGWIYTCQTMSTMRSISFVEFIRITFNNKMTVIGPDDNYPNSAWLCAWCKHKVYIGLPYRQVPQDLRAWFLSPQQYEELERILHEGGEL